MYINIYLSLILCCCRAPHFYYNNPPVTLFSIDFSKPCGCLFYHYVFTAIESMQNQVAILYYFVVLVRGFGGTWVCGESWLAPQFSRLGT